MSKKATSGASRGSQRGSTPLKRGFLRGIPLRLGGLLGGHSPLSSTHSVLSGSLLRKSKFPKSYFNLNHRIHRMERDLPPLQTPSFRAIKICQRRHVRRSVLFAKKGLNGSAKKNYTDDSKVRC